MLCLFPRGWTLLLDFILLRVGIQRENTTDNWRQVVQSRCFAIYFTCNQQPHNGTENKTDIILRLYTDVQNAKTKEHNVFESERL